jgi:serralysin
MAYTRNIDDGYHGDWSLGRLFADDIAYAPTGPRTPLDASVDGQGGTIRGKPVFTIDEAAYYLNRGDGLITVDGVTYESGAYWQGAAGVNEANRYYTGAAVKGLAPGATLTTLSFGFYETRETLPEPYQIELPSGAVISAFTSLIRGFSALSEAQRVAARDAIKQWDDLISVSFVEKPFGDADINFMNTTTGPAQASAYLPYSYGGLTYTNGQPVLNADGQPVTYDEIAGDVYINPSQASNQQFDEGQYGLTTLIHELGHSLGLEHPGAYNFGPGFAVTYENGAEYYQDSNQYSIMSYWDSEETGANHVDWALMTYRYPSTPMVHDIAAIQRIYGADMTTRTGNTVYGFNSNAGNESFDFNLTPVPVATIWDAGGNDTIDVSGFDTPSIINLNEGAYSSVGGIFSETIPTLDEINARRAAAGLPPRTQATYDLYLEITGDTYRNGLMTDNLGIAYGAIIENAIGGRGNDLLIANPVANRLDGGAGFDTVSYRDAKAAVNASLAQDRGLGGDALNDRYINIEALEGSRFDDTLTGGKRNDTLVGLAGNDQLFGNDGNDVLDGGAGDDRLEGGNGDDTLRGGAGIDVLNGGNGNDNLNGGADNDVLNGGIGNDVINGGAGADRLTGGAGADTFVFTETGFTDVITDFTVGVDKVDFRSLDANTNTAGIDAFTFIRGDQFSGTAGELRAFRIGGNAFVQGDTNGDGIADFTIEFGRSTVWVNDFILA